MFVLTKKLKILKERLKAWNKDSLAMFMMLIKIAELNLQAIQHVIQINGPSEAYLIEEKEAHKKFEEAMDRQETFWKEKAHLN